MVDTGLPWRGLAAAITLTRHARADRTVPPYAARIGLGADGVVTGGVATDSNPLFAQRFVTNTGAWFSAWISPPKEAIKSDPLETMLRSFHLPAEDLVTLAKKMLIFLH